MLLSLSMVLLVPPLPYEGPTHPGSSPLLTALSRGASRSPELRPVTIPLAPTPGPYAVQESPSAPAPTAVTAGDSFVYPGVYNAASGSSGSVLIQNPGGSGPLRASVNFSRVAPAQEGVVGYPEIQYGAKPWCAVAPCPQPPLAPSLHLPMPLAKLPPLAADVAYSLSAAPGAPVTPFDLAFDLWLTQQPHPSQATRGDVEAMFWLDYSDPSILPGNSSRDGSVAVADATPSGSARWDVFTQDADLAAGTDHWTVVYLVLETPRPSASVELDLGAMLRTVATVLAEEFPGSWSVAGRTGTEDPLALYLEDVELGSEFLPAPRTVPGRADYVWELSRYSLRVGTEAVGSAPAGGASSAVAWLPTYAGPGLLPAAGGSALSVLRPRDPPRRVRGARAPGRPDGPA